jgi:hypothetical protein
MTVGPQAPEQTLRRLAVRRGLLVLVAVLIAEAVWIMAVPPFRGSDEVDHTYRAAGVARGEWHLSQGTPEGRGLLVRVPEGIVDAAQGQCSALKYMLRYNCHPMSTANGEAVVTTAAGAYDPFYYLAIGTAARPFHGAAADYAMRVATAIFCALLIGLAAGVLTFAGSGTWASLGLLTALVPEVLFSGAIAAPNGPEMALGLLMWAGLLAAVRQEPTQLRRQRRLLWVAIAAAVPLTFVRFLGPFWVLAILASVILLIGVRATKDLVARHRRTIVAGVVLVGLAACWYARWYEISAQVTGTHSDKQPEVWGLAFDLPAFLMQLVGAFPFRSQPAPLATYPLVFLVVGLLFFAAWRRAVTARSRRAVLVIGIVSLVLPTLFALAFMSSLGAVWQGRYEIPYMIGILPLCGLLLDDAGFAPVEGPRLALLSVVMLGIAQVVDVYHVQVSELRRAVSAADSSWFHPPSLVTGLLMLLAWATACLLLRMRMATPAAVTEPVLSDAGVG